MEAMIPVWVKQAIVLLSFLAFPGAVLAGYLGVRSKVWRLPAVLFLIGCLVFIYARFVEPQRLVTSVHEVELCGDGLPGNVRVAVASDFHIGIFPNAMPLQRIVKTVQQGQADLLLIPGDFTYHLDPEQFDEKFGALAELDIPVVAVMGNHDEGIPGPNLVRPLRASLERLGVRVLNPGAEVVQIRGKFLRIVGTRDYWAVQRDGEPVVGEAGPLDMATILLQHNPDMILEDGAGEFDLMVAGHTHGGQVLLPWITCHLTFACRTLRYGYADTPAGQLFVTSGTGMVSLPLRFGVPPKVDFLDLAISRCRADYIPDRIGPNLKKPGSGGKPKKPTSGLRRRS